MNSQTIFDVVLYFVIFHHVVFALALVLVGIYVGMRRLYHFGTSLLLALPHVLLDTVEVCVVALLWLLLGLTQLATFVFMTLPVKLSAVVLVAKMQRAERVQMAEATRIEVQRVAEIRRVGEEARSQMNRLYTDYQSSLHKS
ncbi:MAG: hypothetical protein H0U76_08905 [Ktedonobacteraceae bacterium]|nr:hypothetical protein [Ktedonobacteraceae bacterium]